MCAFLPLRIPFLFCSQSKLDPTSREEPGDSKEGLRLTPHRFMAHLLRWGMREAPCFFHLYHHPRGPGSQGSDTPHPKALPLAIRTLEGRGLFSLPPSPGPQLEMARRPHVGHHLLVPGVGEVSVLSMPQPPNPKKDLSSPPSVYTSRSGIFYP